MAKDHFFSSRTCDRCGKSLDAGRTMSQFNTEVICLECSDKEHMHPDFRRAVEADISEIRKGNYNFPGIGKPADL